MNSYESLHKMNVTIVNAEKINRLKYRSVDEPFQI